MFEGNFIPIQKKWTNTEWTIDRPILGINFLEKMGQLEELNSNIDLNPGLKNQSPIHRATRATIEPASPEGCVGTEQPEDLRR
jgi:hypothetical protein